MHTYIENGNPLKVQSYKVIHNNHKIHNKDKIEFQTQ